MTRTNILEILISELHDMDLDLPGPVDEMTSFKEDCKMDSLDLAEYVARMEQDFRIQISDDEWQRLQTVKLAADYVEERLAA